MELNKRSLFSLKKQTALRFNAAVYFCSQRMIWINQISIAITWFSFLIK